MENIETYNILRTHQDDIILNLVSYIKNNYPERTQVYYKCRRDLEYIYFALSDSIVNNNDDTVRRIASKFWHKDKRQISSYTVEFLIYDMLATELKNILKADTHHFIDGLIQKLKNIIKNGPDLMYSEQVMQDRRNVVKFDTLVSVPKSLESIVDNCIENTPIQDTTNFVFLKATENDQYIKDFLVKNFFYNDDLNRHMIAISTAPLVYIIQYSEYLAQKDGKIINNDKLQIGIHSGAIMKEVLNFGYDFSFIGCGPTSISQENILEWNKIVNKRWGVNCNDSYPAPLLCCCIGKGIFANIPDNTFYDLPTGDTVKSQIFTFHERKYRQKKLFT